MSAQGNVETVKKFFAAVRSGDTQGLLAVSAEDIEWIVPGKGWPLAGVDVTLTYVVKDRDTRWIDRLITLHGVGEDQRAKLAEIAEKTPVTRAVRAGTEIRTTTGIR